MPDPGFPIYESLTRFVGRDAGAHPDPHGARLPARRRRARVAHHAQDPDAGHQLAGQPDRRRADARTTSSAIAALAIAHDLWVLDDEIYGRILYDGAEHVSIASLPGHGRADHRARRLLQDLRDDRLAAGLCDRAAVARARPTASSSSTRSAAPRRSSQVGAVEALTGPQDDVDAMVVEFKARRDLVVDGLNAIPGVRCATPHGAFYVFPEMSGTGLERRELAERLLQEAGVCVLSGTAFGGVGTEHIRVAYANSRENLTEALARIGRLRRRARPCLTGAPAAGLRHAADPRGGPRLHPRGVRRRRLDRASCRRRGPSCCGACAAVDGLLTLLTDRVDDELLDVAGPRLKVVSNFAVGYDNIDVAACARRGVPRRQHARRADRDDRRPRLRAAARGVRRLPEANASCATADWVTWGPLLLLGGDVYGATLGIVGFGRIGAGGRTACARVSG